MNWLALLTALSTALSRIVEFFLKREERARETVTPPQKPTTVEQMEKRKRSAGSASGSPPES